MGINEPDKIKKYIIDLSSKYNLKFGEKQIDDAVKQYTSQGRTFEEIKQSIDSIMEEKKEIERLKEEIHPTSKGNSYFGQVYKTYLIHVLNIYKEISTSDLTEEKKEQNLNQDCQIILQKIKKI